MWDDATAAETRHEYQQAARRRRRESQRQDLFHAARTLIPEHGVAIALARIAVHAGVSRHAAAGLFNATADLATALVRGAWHALIEATAPAADTTPAQFVAGLIRAIRADAAAHRIHQALACGTPGWQSEAIAAAEAFLALAVAEGLRATWPALGVAPQPDLGRRVLTLARHAALAAEAPDAEAEAAVIIAMATASLARVSPEPAAPDAPADRRRPSPARPARPRIPLPPRRLPAPGREYPPEPPRPGLAPIAPPQPVHDPPVPVRAG